MRARCSSLGTLPSLGLLERKPRFFWILCSNASAAGGLSAAMNRRISVRSSSAAGRSRTEYLGRLTDLLPNILHHIIQGAASRSGSSLTLSYGKLTEQVQLQLDLAIVA